MTVQSKEEILSPATKDFLVGIESPAALIKEGNKIKLFDVNQFLIDNSRDGFQKKSMVAAPSKAVSYDFKAAKKAVQEFLHSKVDDKSLSENEKNERRAIEHRATLGEKDAMDMLMDEITTYLRDSPYQKVGYDRMFRSLAHALFEHIYRFKNFYKWQLFPNSPSAKITGTEIWFKIDGKFEKQAEEFESEEEVHEIIRLLHQNNPNFSLSPENPQGELDLPDGTRVTLTIPPRTLHATIVFRRFIVNKFSFEEQSSYGTIAKDDVPLFKTLARLRLNTVIAGGVESGKSTLLKTIFAERPEDLVALLIEAHPETFLKRDFIKRLVHEFYINGDNLKQILRTILRYDHDYVVMQEVRGFEAEAAIDGASRGAQGMLMTFHLTAAVKICEQLAQHILDEYPSRRYVSQVRRVAETLDIGITMKTFPGNEKRVTSVFEVNYDPDKDKAWISYLMKYDEFTKSWNYSDNLSPAMLKSLKSAGNDTLNEFQTLLSKRANLSPLTSGIVEPILFKDTGGED